MMFDVLFSIVVCGVVYVFISRAIPVGKAEGCPDLASVRFSLEKRAHVVVFILLVSR